MVEEEIVEDDIQLFTEKYRPASLDDVGGYNKLIDEIIEWGNRFNTEIPTIEKGLILHGAEGIGKTSIANAMALDYGWEIVEVNASDSRTYDELTSLLTAHAQTTAIDDINVRKLILIEEVDNLYTSSGRRDFSGERAIIELLIMTNNPVILTCNDIYSVPKAIKDLCLSKQMQRVRPASIGKVLKTIAKAEGTKLTKEVVDGLIVKGDVRSSVNNLQIYLISGIINQGNKEANLSPFELIDRIFKCDDPYSLEGILEKCETNPESAIVWIEENVKHRYKGLERIYAYKALSEADKYIKLAKDTGDYGLYWKLASNAMTIDVALARRFPNTGGWTKTEFPVFYKKLSATKRTRKVKDSLTQKIIDNKLAHTSKTGFKKTDFPIVQRKCIMNFDYLLKISTICKFDENEIAMLLDSDLYDPRIKKVLNAKFNITDEMKEMIERQDNKCKPLTDFF